MASLCDEWIGVEDVEKELGWSIERQNKMRMSFVNGKNPYMKSLKEPLPYSKIGKNILYNRAEISRWIELHRVADVKTYTGKKRGRKPKVATENKENKND